MPLNLTKELIALQRKFIIIILFSMVLPPPSQPMKILVKRMRAIKEKRIIIQLHGNMVLAYLLEIQCYNISMKLVSHVCLT